MWEVRGTWGQGRCRLREEDCLITLLIVARAPRHKNQCRPGLDGVTQTERHWLCDCAPITGLSEKAPLLTTTILEDTESHCKHNCSHCHDYDGPKWTADISILSASSFSNPIWWKLKMVVKFSIFLEGKYSKYGQMSSNMPHTLTKQFMALFTSRKQYSTCRKWPHIFGNLCLCSKYYCCNKMKCIWLTHDFITLIHHPTCPVKCDYHTNVRILHFSHKNVLSGPCLIREMFHLSV